MAIGKGVIVVGAGVGGLTAALLLAARGHAVTLCEAAATPGGKMRLVGGTDAGPTVLTMRWVFDDIFAESGADFGAAVGLEPAAILARHAWGPDRLDLHARARDSADAIGAFAGPAAARAFTTFLADARAAHAALDHTYIRNPAPSRLGLVAGAAARGALGQLARIRPYETLWTALGRHFADPRLRQLFGRYATYSGASPFAAPATLMLIAHVEQQGVWLVDGGMHRVALALAARATALGATIRYASPVAAIHVDAHGASGVTLASGERIEAAAVVVNADPTALAAGRFGAAAARAVAALPPRQRSLSAVTFTGQARARGFPLSRHTVVFSPDYPAEFAALAAGRPPADPTVYIHAASRPADAEHRADPDGAEPLHLIVNAPARPLTREEITECTTATRHRLAASGLILDLEALTPTTPADFERMFPASGGALYGRATHGSSAAFERPTARTRIPGLYLAGGSTHPGAGVPMAALSGRFAADALARDSMRRFHPAATPGGISTRSRTAATTG